GRARRNDRRLLRSPRGPLERGPPARLEASPRGPRLLHVRDGAPVLRGQCLQQHEQSGVYDGARGADLPGVQRGPEAPSRPSPDRECFMDSPVLIVIVNYRTSDLAVECLRSLEAEAGDPAIARVAVVDNLSNDGSVDRLRAAISRNGW